MPGETAFGSPSFWWGVGGKELPNLVNETRLDDMATRVLSAWIKMNQDTDTTFPKLNLNTNVQGNHSEIIRKVGAASTVVLKNEGGVLPIRGTSGKVVVVGSDAADNPNLRGDHNDNTGTLAVGWGSGTSNFPYIIAVSFFNFFQLINIFNPPVV